MIKHKRHNRISLILRALCPLICCALLAAAIPLAAGAGSFYSTAELLKIKSNIESDAGMGAYATVQGGCTDGRYAYFAAQGGSTVILKYDMKTWKLADSASVGGLGHANDMTYNPDKGYLVVANNYSTNDVLTLLDPDSLRVVGTAEPRQEKTKEEIEKEAKKKKKDPEEIEKFKRIKVYSIAYDPSRRQYAVGLSGTYDFGLLNEKFELVKKFDGVSTGYTRQGCDCDGDYIYFTQSGGSNAVVIYDYSGRQVDMISLGHSHEVENIFHVGSDFYTTLHYYGNFVHRVGMSKRTQIRFTVHYDPAGGYGEMADASVHYGEDTPLSKCSFEKPGYFFGGWQVRRDSDEKLKGYRLGSDKAEWLSGGKLYNTQLYKDEAKVAKLVKFGSATLSAFWINEKYYIHFDSDGAQGYMEPDEAEYREEYALPKNGFYKPDHIFAGYTASRDCDGRVYGYRKGSEQPEWLRPGDVKKKHLFKEGDVVKEFTYDGTVTFTAQFSYAYIFDESGETLEKYIGVDDKVIIPNDEGKLRSIASSAFEENETMRELYVPDTVESIAEGAIVNCPNLLNIYFTDGMPKDMDNAALQSSGTPLVFDLRGGEPLCLGFYPDKTCAPIIKCNARTFERNFSAYLKSAKNNSVIE